MSPARSSAGNRFTPLYSFNGTSPGPTIRTRGDAVLRVKLRNMLGPNHGQVPKGPTPDPFEIPPKRSRRRHLCDLEGPGRRDCSTPPLRVLEHLDELLHHIPATMVDTSCLASPANVPHGSHTTNLHTHGVHVYPGTNANGTQGDNTFLRVLPRGDWEIRQRNAEGCPRALEPHERVGEADFEFALGNVMRSRPRPPRHAPATSSGHALVSPALPRRDPRSGRQRPCGLLHHRRGCGRRDQSRDDGHERPDPTEKTGPFDYRERVMMIQRVEVSSARHGRRSPA